MKISKCYICIAVLWLPWSNPIIYMYIYIGGHFELAYVSYFLMHEIGFSYSRWTYSVIIVSTWVTAWMLVYTKTVMLWQMKHLHATIWSCESWMSRNLALGLCLCKHSYMHNTMKSVRMKAFIDIALVCIFRAMAWSTSYMNEQNS